jgi:hypothetical protein
MVIKTKLIHLDSKFATYLDNNDNFGDVILPSMSKNSSLYARFNLQSAIKNVRKIYLKSVEMPILFNNIRQGKTDRYSSDRIIATFEKPTVTKNITAVINESLVYEDIDILLTKLNTALTNVLNPDFTPSLSILSNTRNIMLTCTDASSVTFTDTVLSRDMLGFDNAFTFPELTAQGVWLAFDRYNINIDNYVNIFIENIPLSNNNLSSVNSSFKLPINAILGDVLYYTDSEYFEQSVDVIDPNFILRNLDILFTDRFGNRIYAYNTDYSMTLMIEYDE